MLKYHIFMYQVVILYHIRFIHNCPKNHLRKAIRLLDAKSQSEKKVNQLYTSWQKTHSKSPSNEPSVEIWEHLKWNQRPQTEHWTQF